jgi:dolichol-phosphate mannosyltransferase
MHTFVNEEHKPKPMGINERMGISLEEYTNSRNGFATGDSTEKIRVGQMMETEFQGEPKIAVVLPTYCEAENIESLIRELQELKLNLLIAVIDDSSPDGTADMVKKLQEEYDNIVLFVRPKKLGLGTAITTGFQYMLKLRKPPNFIVTMDADYSHDPRDIPRLVGFAEEGYDLVIGSRYRRGGKVIGLGLRRRLISRFANIVAAATVGTKLQDCTSGFRCYSQSYVKDVLQKLHSQTYEIQIETLRQARMNKFKVKETPITFVNRKKGKSKLTTLEILAFLTYIARTTLERVASLLKSKISI